MTIFQIIYKSERFSCLFDSTSFTVNLDIKKHFTIGFLTLSGGIEM